MSAWRRGVVGFLAFLPGFVIALRADSPFALRDGNHVVFYGDEVTAVQFYDDPREPRIYTTFIEAYAITRFPQLHLDFVNSGWNGDRVSGGAGGSIEVRLERDVIAYKPSVLTVMLGMNDAWMTAFDPKLFEAFTTGYEHQVYPEMEVFDSSRFEEFTTGYEHLIDLVKTAAPAIRVTLLKPLVPVAHVDQQKPPEGGSSVMLRYGRWLDEIGERDHLTVVDPNPVLEAAAQQAKDAGAGIVSGIMSDDRHPGTAGHLIIAAAVLRAWHAPALVSRIEIDARRGRVLRAENSSVREIKRAGGLFWTQIDNALPFLPELDDAAVAFLVRLLKIDEGLDEQMLKLTGLGRTNYELRIDGEFVGSFSGEQLGTGINLALLNTPMRKQATRVFKLVQQRDNVHFGRWKRLEFPLQGIEVAHKQEALNALDRLERELVEAQYRAAKPRPHRYDLVPIRN